MNTSLEHLLEERYASIDKFYDAVKEKVESHIRSLTAKPSLTDKEKIELHLEQRRAERNERERFEAKVKARKTLIGVK